jgi:cytochrome c-type biogenesis protein CcmH
MTATILARARACIAGVAFLSVSAVFASAVQPDEMLSDPALEARARVLSRELRCMVCQNQSIDDSEAPLARDLRLLVRERLRAGDSDRQVIDFLVARYGEFVLLNPRVSAHSIWLWLIPIGVLLSGAAGLVLHQRRRSLAASAEEPLSAEEERKITALTRRDMN